ncbi:MAG TPA: 23S rRNA (pseudouridine(1915)-N(3))-methyltransferase RlmH [Lachnospiraceae bacterium]|nr:23S rRNA (pseudouridine(1915)-N(3))-methyltransferase RlmH [Lachnospiraceae bacterium]
MNIDLICVGKIKESYLKAAILEYEKRLSRYCRLKIIETADEKTPDGQSSVLDNKIRQTEAERILKHIKKESCVISLEIGGEMLDSVELSKKIETLGINGTNNIQFIIGGSLGLHPSVSEMADLKLSFSKMTFPHQLMRVILLEQVYRSYRIMHNEPYHK